MLMVAERKTQLWVLSNNPDKNNNINNLIIIIVFRHLYNSLHHTKAKKFTICLTI